MILIDTNVISELMRPKPAPEVLAWFGGQNTMELHASAVGEAELRRDATTLRYVHLYNGELPQSALKGRKHIDALNDWHHQKPEPFNKPPHSTSGM